MNQWPKQAIVVGAQTGMESGCNHAEAFVHHDQSPQGRLAGDTVSLLPEN
ncbi:MAG TPA: hypothetical protein VJ783_22430 [Pirellulales bacterium]|nr:hypothetical protein [Pirellulales bacterium]